jgi:hypothetical protein
MGGKSFAKAVRRYDASTAHLKTEHLFGAFVLEF